MSPRRLSFEPSSVAEGYYTVWSGTKPLGAVQRYGPHSWGWALRGTQFFVGYTRTRREAAEMLDLIVNDRPIPLLVGSPPAGPTDKASQLASRPECQLDSAGPTDKEKRHR